MDAVAAALPPARPLALPRLRQRGVPGRPAALRCRLAGVLLRGDGAAAAGGIAGSKVPRGVPSSEAAAPVPLERRHPGRLLLRLLTAGRCSGLARQHRGRPPRQQERPGALRPVRSPRPVRYGGPSPAAGPLRGPRNQAAGREAHARTSRRFIDAVTAAGGPGACW